MTLPAGSSGSVSITFTPSNRGPVNGEMNFVTSANTGDILAATFNGEGWIPPTAEFAATSISVVTSPGADLSFELGLVNNGD